MNTITPPTISTTCVFCGKNVSAAHHASLSWEELASSWYRCHDCNGLMILPLPDDDQLQKVYGENYRDRRLQPHAGVDNRIRYSPHYRSEVFKEYDMSLQDLGIGYSVYKTILDFGCADGVFLEFCRLYFPKDTELYGADIAEDMLEDARHKGFAATHVDKIDTFERQFDLITLWDVLEHLPNPYHILKNLTVFLSDKGKIVIQTPRFGIIGEVWGENWEHLLPVQHVSVASYESIRKLAERLGLVIEKQLSFGANAPATHIQQPFKGYFDTLVKQLDSGSVQLVSLKRKTS